ncbi:DUF732 domain-containing protein [Amycolatopsis orientalis]|uniref:DUF732 domain-containing protein n=1 Tax=Amycolatopsis orientalis TaxID=31958 RepID=UPI001268B5F2
MKVRWSSTTAFGAIAYSIVLAGCSSNPPTDHTPAPPTPARTQAEITFLDRVHTAQTTLTDDDALTTGRMTCADWDVLRDGHAPQKRYSELDLENLGQSGKLTTSQVRALEQAAVENLCPANLVAYQRATSR